MNCGSGDSLKLSTRCGFRPKARQILEIPDCDIPSAAAIDLVDQCVALGGCSSSVVTITASTCASVIVRGAPGRGSSCSPSSRHCAKRRRHLPTVTGWQSSARGDRPIRCSLGRCKDDATAQRQRLGRCRPARPPLQRLTLLVAQDDGDRRPSDSGAHDTPESAPWGKTPLCHTLSVMWCYYESGH